MAEAPKPKKKTGGKKKGDSIFDKLNDPSQYTGAHKQRFDKDGHGRGKEGRTDEVGGADFKDLMRPGFRGEKERFPVGQATVGSGGGGTGKKKTGGKKKGGGGPSIFDKLNDPSQYTGAHKQRFDKDGHGRGKEGRTDEVGGADFKDLMRPGFRGEKERFPVGQATVGSGGGGTGKKKTGGKKKGGGPSIFDKLTDSSQYTGAHRQRFDKEGHGRGKAGRTDADTSDLSKITDRSKK